MALNVSSALLQSYAYWSSILALKLFFMVILTAFNRIRKGAFANPEDLMDKKKQKVTLADPDVERVRRAHLNDLENILPFFAIGFLYITTSPALSTANLLFKVFAISRIVHTLVYAIFPIPQPARALAFFVGMGINVYMTVQILLHNA